MKYHIVIAKYKENIDWTNSFSDKQNIIIYDKSGSNDLITDINVRYCPNVGREAHTYIQYICDHYHNLPDKIVFLQGSPFHRSINQHNANFEKYILDLISKCKKNVLPVIYSGKINKEDKCNVIYKKQLQILFGENKYTFINEYVKSAQMVVPKELIIDKPFTFWKNMLEPKWKNIPKKKSGKVEPMFYKLPNAWIYEMIWLSIFYNKYPHKESIL